MLLPANSVFCFDTLFNAFFERHWYDYTKIADFGVTVEISGASLVSVWRKSSLAGEVCIGSFLAGGENKSTTLLFSEKAYSKLQQGRVFLKITTQKTPVTFHSGSWITRTAPSRDVTVAAVMCTFNKAQDVARNISGLLEQTNKSADYGPCFVIDQGTAKVRDSSGFPLMLNADQTRDRLRIIEQPNLGGSGGFTRGMIEALGDKTVTHVLLMDDDIDIDSRVYARLGTLLRYVADDACIGGEMFDLFCPTKMHAHAERANFDSLHYETLYPCNIDFTEPHAGDAFLKTQLGTYNGWWFCCFPRSAIEAHGLPLPFFIRCDDSEFGTRLTGAGVPLLQFPGIMVWHEPFYAKVSAWMVYYECRNFLIMANLRRGRARRPAFLSYAKRFWGYLSSYQYDHAFAVCKAIEDYLLGPDRIFNDLSRRHDEIMREFKSWAPHTQRRRPDVTLQEMPDVRIDGSSRVRRLLKGIQWNLLLANKAPRDPEVYIPLQFSTRIFMHGRESVGIHNPHTDLVTYLPVRRQLARSLTRRFAVAVFRWWRNSEALNSEYRDRFTTYSSREHWNRLLR